MTYCYLCENYFFVANDVDYKAKGLLMCSVKGRESQMVLSNQPTIVAGFATLHKKGADGMSRVMIISGAIDASIYT
jgi:hypothetical protein